MSSATKDRLRRRHTENTLLSTPAPPFTSRTSNDLSGDQPRGIIAPDVARSAVEALHSGQTHYVDVPGIAPLRAALAAYLNESFGQAYEADDVLVTAGVQEARFLTVQKIGEQFDEISIPAVVHPGVRRALGTRPLTLREIAVDEANGMLVPPSSVQAALKQGARLLYLESPSRLTGQTYDRAAVAELVDLIQEYGAAIIWDQGLAPWLPGNTFASPGRMREIANQVTVIGEAWPGMGLDSWFIGYIAAGPSWFEPMRSQKQIMAICTSTASQYAALAAGEAYQETHTANLKKLGENRQAAVAAAVERGLRPLPGDAASLLAFRPAADARVVQKNLEKAGYMVADGADFGAPGVLRINVSLTDTTVEALKSLA